MMLLLLLTTSALAAAAAPGNITVTRMMNNTNFPGGDLPTHLGGVDMPPNTPPEKCQALCDKTPECHAWTFLERGGPAGHDMSCCIKGTIETDG